MIMWRTLWGDNVRHKFMVLMLKRFYRLRQIPVHTV